MEVEQLEQQALASQQVLQQPGEGPRRAQEEVPLQQQALPEV